MVGKPTSFTLGCTSNQSGSGQPDRQFHRLPYPARSDRHRLSALPPAGHRGETLQVRNRRTRLRIFPKERAGAAGLYATIPAILGRKRRRIGNRKTNRSECQPGLASSGNGIHRSTDQDRSARPGDRYPHAACVWLPVRADSGVTSPRRWRGRPKSAAGFPVFPETGVMRHGILNDQRLNALRVSKS